MFKSVVHWIKHNFTEIVIAISMMVFCYSIFFNIDIGFKILSVIYFLVFQFFSGRRTQAKGSKKEELRRRGLTEEDIYNIAFVKQWDEIREEGKLKYLVLDGGIICAFGLGFLLFITAAYFSAKVYFLMARVRYFPLLGIPFLQAL